MQNQCVKGARVLPGASVFQELVCSLEPGCSQGSEWEPVCSPEPVCSGPSVGTPLPPQVISSLRALGFGIGEW